MRLPIALPLFLSGIFPKARDFLTKIAMTEKTSFPDRKYPWKRGFMHIIYIKL